VKRGVGITCRSVKWARFGDNDDLEIVVSSKSAINNSPKKFKVADETEVSGNILYVVVEDVQSLNEQHCVNVVDKVVFIS